MGVAQTLYYLAQITTVLGFGGGGSSAGQEKNHPLNILSLPDKRVWGCSGGETSDKHHCWRTKSHLMQEGGREEEEEWRRGTRRNK